MPQLRKFVDGMSPAERGEPAGDAWIAGLFALFGRIRHDGLDPPECGANARVRARPPGRAIATLPLHPETLLIGPERFLPSRDRRQQSSTMFGDRPSLPETVQAHSV